MENTDTIPSKSNKFENRVDLTLVQTKFNQVMEQFDTIVIGQKELKELMLICLVSNGHILLEGVPGIAKTLSAKVLAKTVNAGFSRIQFTPDLMPADIIGTSIFNMKESKFIFNKGPIFSNIILIDEINRAPAKTQSALFEVMEERQISFDGESYKMKFPFIVIATQNPIEQEGTYRLPEAQLDRFLMKIRLNYPSKQEELSILHRFQYELGSPELSKVKKVLTQKALKEIQTTLKEIYVEELIFEYITSIVHETRNDSKIYLGASPRASLALLNSSKVAAILNGRDFVIPDDVKFVAPHILNHRLILTPDTEMEGRSTYDVIDEILQTVEIPR